MKRACSLGAVLLLVAACSSVRQSGVLPKVAEIATPESAEKAIYIAAKLYESAMTQINQAHARGSMTDERHDALVAKARTIQSGLLAAWDGVALWETTGVRFSFDNAYSKTQSEIESLGAAGGK